MSRPPGTYRLTLLAQEDVAGILKESARLFGPTQRERYAALIEKAATLVAEDPDRPGSRPRGDLAEDIRSFHVERAARRRGAAAHLLYYLPAPDGVLVLRVLHERMEPAAHLAGVLD